MNIFLLSITLLGSLLAIPYSGQAQKKSKQGGPPTVNGIKIPAAGRATSPLKASDVPISTRSVKFGVGVGVSGYLKNVYSYALTAPSYTLASEKISPVAGVFSGVVIFNKSIFYYPADSGSSTATGEAYARTNPISALLAVNLATFAASATSTAAGFNTRLDLGVGVGYRFDENFQIGLMLDFASLRFLRDAYTQYEGKPMPVYATSTTATTMPATTPAQPLTALDPTDEHYFISHTVPSLSLKFIYNLTPEQPSAKAAQATKQDFKAFTSFR